MTGPLEKRIAQLEHAAGVGEPGRIIFRVVYDDQEPPDDYTETILDDRPGRPRCVVRWPKVIDFHIGGISATDI